MTNRVSKEQRANIYMATLTIPRLVESPFFFVIFFLFNASYSPCLFFLSLTLRQKRIMQMFFLFIFCRFESFPFFTLFTWISFQCFIDFYRLGFIKMSGIRDINVERALATVSSCPFPSDNESTGRD